MDFLKWCPMFLVLLLALVAVRADDYEDEHIGDYAYDEGRYFKPILAST